MSSGRHLKILPLLPERSQRSGAMKGLRDKGLSGIATVATTFNNLNKKNDFRKNFSISCGNSGNKAKFVYIGHRLIKKIVPSRPPPPDVITKFTKLKEFTCHYLA